MLATIEIPHGDTVLLHRYGHSGVDRYGKKTPGFDEPLELHGVGIDVTPPVEAKSAEVKDGTVQRATVDLVAYVPPGISVGSKDEFTVHGDRYQVVGVAPPMKNFFTGSVFYTEVRLKRHDG